MGRALSRRMLRAIFFKMKLKGIARKPKPPVTLEDLARAYKLPKTQATAPAKPLKISKRPSRGRRAKGSRRKKQEIIIKVETPKSTVPENPRRRTPKPKTETPQLEGAAKESETKTRREKFIEGSETVSAGETYAAAATGLFGFIKARKRGIKKVGMAGAEGAVAGGAGTAVYKLTTEEEKKKKKKRKKTS